jgi:hypothetical protein
LDSITGLMVSCHRNAGFLSTGIAVSKSPDTGVTEPGILNREGQMERLSGELRVRKRKYIAYTRALDELYAYDKIIEIPESFVIEGNAKPNSNNNINQTTAKTIQNPHKETAPINTKIGSIRTLYY